MMSYKSDREVYKGAVERLKDQMKLAGLSQAELSKRTGISASNLSRFLKGRWEFVPDRFWLKLKKCRDVDLKYVMYGI